MFKDKNKTVQKIISTVAWICFLWLPFILFPYNRDAIVTKADWFHFLPPDIAIALKSDRFVYSYIVSILLIVNFYYFNKGYLIPNILARKRTIPYIAIVTACFFFYLTILYIIVLNSNEHKEWLNSIEFKTFIKQMLAKNPNYVQPSPRYFSTGPMALFLLLFVVGLGSNVVNQWFSAEEKKEEISKQQLQTELSFLKSQVNPHFLFNSLNSIYSLSVANSKQTSDAVMKLSRILRYTLEEANNNIVNLGQEIEFLRNYIELQKIRLTENVGIKFITKGDTGSVSIAPLLLIPFVENAFKYGTSTHNESSIYAEISVEGREIVFSCINTNFPVMALKNKGTGTGIANTRRRLELLYGDKHTLDIKETPESFCVTLTLKAVQPALFPQN
jgi:sensor histidine kinase YesM